MVIIFLRVIAALLGLVQQNHMHWRTECVQDADSVIVGGTGGHHYHSLITTTYGATSGDKID